MNIERGRDSFSLFHTSDSLHLVTNLLFKANSGMIVVLKGDTMKSVGDTVEKLWDSAGDVVNGFFSGVGSVFN